MTLALVRKELRETWAFAVLALALYLVGLSKLTAAGGPLLQSLVGIFPGNYGPAPDIPFVQDNFGSWLFLIGAALAIGLGFRQSAWEPFQGTAQYLFHLPRTRRFFILTKLLTGIGLLLASTLPPILAYALWAATPGTHPGPFEWMMTGSAFRTWMILPLFYLGAFASGIRPARWYGSRLFPLISVPAPALASYVLGPWWLIGVPLLCLTAALLVADILWVAATRDY